MIMGITCVEQSQRIIFNVEWTGNSWQRRNLENWATMSTLIPETITRAFHPEQITQEGEGVNGRSIKITKCTLHKTCETLAQPGCKGFLTRVWKESFCRW